MYIYACVCAYSCERERVCVRVKLVQEACPLVEIPPETA